MRYAAGLGAIAVLGLVLSPAPALAQLGGSASGAGSPGGAVTEDELAPPPANPGHEEARDEAMESAPSAPSAPANQPRLPEDAARMNPYGESPPEQEEAE